MKKNISIAIFLMMVLMDTSCKKDKSSGPDGPDKTGNEWKGIGHSPETPSGAAFHLPEGIELANNVIKGYNRNECACRKEDVACHRGSGKLESVCPGFTNTTNQTIMVTVPSGLVIIATSTETQNGLVIQIETFEVPANSTVYYSVGAYCLNAGRSPSFTGDKFEFGPITQNEHIRELTELVKNKRIDTDDASATVQAALWNITDGDGLTSYDRQAIAVLPNR
ncbi:MAG TPA: thioester domain-containing protein [Chitinophagaceae bacterium]|nr:thioester domain-containing protein [Chitinophagaceae bacterium]